MQYKNFYHLSSVEYDQFIDFLKSFRNDPSPAIQNMWDDDWPNKSNTILYLLNNSKRFKEPKGSFYIYYNNDEIAACAGVYVSDFNPHITLSAVRLLIGYKYRHQRVGINIVFPHHRQWAIEHNQKMIATTFNEYNKNLSEIFTRKRFGESVTADEKINQPNKFFYNGYNKLSFPVKIQNTKQWVVYEYLDTSWQYDWQDIKYKEEQ